MILNKYSLNFIYQISKGIFKICIFSKVSIKVEKLLYTILHTDCEAYFLRYRKCYFRKLTNVSKKKGLTLLKKENPSELNFFYFRIATYQFFFSI